MDGIVIEIQIQIVYLIQKEQQILIILLLKMMMMIKIIYQFMKIEIF